jgi:hypothetical protein
MEITYVNQKKITFSCDFVSKETKRVTPGVVLRSSVMTIYIYIYLSSYYNHKNKGGEKKNLQIETLEK